MKIISFVSWTRAMSLGRLDHADIRSILGALHDSLRVPVFSGLIVALIVLAGSFPVAGADPSITIHSTQDLAQKRTDLIKFIWGTSWSEVQGKHPKTELIEQRYSPVPDDVLPDVPLDNLDRIERVPYKMEGQAETGTGLYTHQFNAYIFHPKTPNGRFVIVHQGHDCVFGPVYNLDQTVIELVKANYSVVVMRMPLYQSKTMCPGSESDSKSHADMFKQPLKTGSPLQFFLEPVAVMINYIATTYPSPNLDFNMVGLSGGGWTTTLYAAIDPRIVLSFPVSGSLPLNLPNSKDPCTGRDAEQCLNVLYDKIGYKDLYVMGSFGPTRRQTQILSMHDACCFGVTKGEPTPDAIPPDASTAEVAAYTCDVQNALSGLGSGSYSLFVDSLADPPHPHQITIAALQALVIPTLALGSNSPVPGSCAANLPATALSIASQSSTKCLDVGDGDTSDNAVIQQYPCQSSGNQRWNFTARGEIISQNSIKCLGVRDSSLENKALLQQSACTGAPNQLWRITALGQVINQNSGKCLDVPKWDSGNVAIQQFTCASGATNSGSEAEGANNQRWVFP